MVLAALWAAREAPRLAALFAVLSVALTGVLGAMLGASRGAASRSASPGVWSDSGVVCHADGGGLYSGLGYNMARRLPRGIVPGGFEGCGEAARAQRGGLGGERHQRSSCCFMGPVRRTVALS